ncbi:MAG TPA: NosD domain-containing protein [Methanotrichaceae archaeon]|nr:NosD domain-containing protein [Methanotrichaceae archaeon]
MEEPYVKLLSARVFFLISFLAIAPLAALGNGAVITVEPGESIQDAVNRARPGDIIEVESGYYEESVYVDKPLILRGQKALGKPTIIEAQSREGAVVLDANGCSLEKLVIKNSKGCGICVLSDFNNICNNSIPVAQTGIYLEDCQGNRIARNIVFSSWYLGTGIELSQSCNNSLVKNTAFGGWLSTAIRLWDGSNNNTIVNNFARDDGWCGNGIDLQDSCDNIILHNTASTDSKVLGANGICIGWASNNNTIRENTACGSGWKGNGIYIFSSDNNTIAKNNVSSRGDSESDGIFLCSSDNNTLMGNNVSDNRDYGIDLLSSSDNNTIMNNVVRDNAKGIFIHGYNNTIYLNDFINNGVSAHSWDLSTRWCSPMPMTYQYNDKTIKGYLGNRWSDYQGKDATGDGIGDRPYTFDDGEDAYPLMRICDQYSKKFME